MPYPSTSDAIELSIASLAATFPTLCTRTPFPNATNSVGMPARTYSFLKIGKGTGPNRPAVLIVAGIHAREWGQPDGVLTFAGNLLRAYPSSPFTILSFTDSGGTVHGPVVVPDSTVKTIIEKMDIYLVPNANPDGRAFTMAAPGNRLWRKNRGGTPTPALGTDLNRNFDIAWDFDVYYSSVAATHPDFASHTSKNTGTDVYIGTAPFSENETKNIKFLLDTFPISYYVDCHSFSQLVMHPWGIETNGTTPAQNFRNAAFNGLRDGNLGTTYQEFFPNGGPLRLLDRHVTMANSIRDSIRDATGAVYTAGPSLQLYPCTGASDDYAFSRQFDPATPREMHGFSIEFGDATENFQPTPVQFRKVEREIHAALITFVKQIAVWNGLVPSGTTPPPASTPVCFIATAAFGSLDHPDVQFINSIHAALEAHWLTGPAVTLAEKLYNRAGPKVAGYLDNHELPRRLLRQVMFVPLVAVLRRFVSESNRDAK